MHFFGAVLEDTFLILYAFIQQYKRVQVDFFREPRRMPAHIGKTACPAAAGTLNLSVSQRDILCYTVGHVIFLPIPIKGANILKCNYCEWRCNLSSSPGICGRYAVHGNRVAEVAPFEWVQYYPYPVEGMPFYHVMPSARVIQIGSVRCNAGCDYCINSHLAIHEDKQRTLKRLSPEQLVEIARKEDAQGSCLPSTR